jgi:hypothetical protein
VPYQLLRYLVTVEGPIALIEADDIERIILLRSAGLVEAEIPPTIQSEDGRIRYAGAALIHRVTAAGRKVGHLSSAQRRVC